MTLFEELEKCFVEVVKAEGKYKMIEKHRTSVEILGKMGLITTTHFNYKLTPYGAVVYKDIRRELNIPRPTKPVPSENKERTHLSDGM